MSSSPRSKMVILAILMAGILLSACLPAAGAPTIAAPTRPAPLPTTSPTPYQRATPQSQEPAAGICAGPDGDVQTFTLRADTPDPRCMVFSGAQKLRVINETGKTVRVSIGPFAVELAPGGAHLFDAPVGEYLLPGVHLVQVEPCCSPALWLK